MARARVRVYKYRRDKKDKQGTWYLEFRDPTGKRVRMPSGRPTERTSQAIADEYAQKLAAGEDPRGARDDELSFPALVERFLRDYRPRSGRMTYYVSRSKVWLQHFSGFSANGITVPDVDRYRAAREAKVGPATVRKDLVSLSTLFRWAKVRKLVKENPAEPMKVKRPPEPKHRTGYLTEAEEASLLAAAPTWIRPSLSGASTPAWTAVRSSLCLGVT